MSAGACPTLEHLVSAMGAPENDLNRKTAEEHLKMCPNCRAEYDLWKDFEESRPLPREEKDVEWIVRRLEVAAPRRTRPAAWWQSLLVALPPLRLSYLVPVAAAAVLLLVVVTRPPEELGTVPRIESGAMRTEVLSAVEPVGDLGEVPRRFVWEAVAGAQFYVVTVFEVDRRLIWSGRSATPDLEIPADLRRFIQPGKTLLWSVSALGDSGSRLAESEVKTFQVGRPSQDHGHG